MEEQAQKITLQVIHANARCEQTTVSLSRSEFGDKVVAWRNKLEAVGVYVAWTPFLLDFACKCLDFPVGCVTIELRTCLMKLQSMKWWQSDAEYINSLFEHICTYITKHKELCEEYLRI